MFLLFQAIKIITSPKGSPPRGARPLNTLPPSPCDAPDSRGEPGRPQSELQQHTCIVTETPVQCKPNNTIKSKIPANPRIFLHKQETLAGHPSTAAAETPKERKKKQKQIAKPKQQSLCSWGIVIIRGSGS